MKGALRAGIIAAVVVLLLAIALIVLAAIFNFLLDLLYITLIVLAAFSLISTGFLIYTMLLLIQSIVTVRNEMRPLLASVQETVGIVKDTAKTAEHTASTIGSTAQLTKEFALAPSVRAVLWPHGARSLPSFSSSTCFSLSSLAWLLRWV